MHKNGSPEAFTHLQGPSEASVGLTISRVGIAKATSFTATSGEALMWIATGSLVGCTKAKGHEPTGITMMIV